MEARAGFEPANDGFADHSLGPLGYRALLLCPFLYPMVSGLTRSRVREYSCDWALRSSNIAC